MKISCFIAGAETADLNLTINELQWTSVKEIFVVSASNPNIDSVGWIKADSFTLTSVIKRIAEKSNGDFTLFYTNSLPLKIGQHGLERMARMAAQMPDCYILIIMN